MKKRKTIILAASIVGLVVVWAMFRPELLFINASVNEEFPPAAMAAASPSAPLASGTFHGVAHETKGVAAVYEVGQKRVLRLTGFSTSNGPDLRVLLVATGDALDSDTVKQAGSIEVAPLKGNIGDQNYDLPQAVDLAKHRAVTIWCNRFGVNFATAPLKMGGEAAAPAAASPAPPVLSGKFHGVAHKTQGTASVYDLPDGKRVLRLTGFETSNGPDLRVLLVATGDASDSDTVKRAGSIEVGKLKGNIGDQNYDVPEGVDLAKHRAVTIWCNRFGVNFATAPLMASNG